MSADIVSFPKPRAPTGLSDQQKRQVELEQQRREIIQKVRSAAANPKSKFGKRDDEIAPAQAVSRLIAEAKAAKVTQVDIREALAKKNISTRHLERLRVDHTIPPAEAKKKASNDLTRKIRHYVQVLDLLAEKLGRAPDHVIFDAFRETSFARSATVPIDDPAANLSWLLNEMADWVIRSQKLDDYFREVRRIHASYDPMTDQLQYGGLGAEYQQMYEGGADFSQTLHALPAIPLARIHRATFAGKLDVERGGLAESERGRTEVATIARRTAKHKLGPTETRDAEITLFSDVRFAVGPRTRHDDLGPLFEIRSHVEMKTEGKARQLTFDLGAYPLYARNDTEDCELDTYVGSVAAQFDDGWRRITGFGRQGWKLTAGKYWTTGTGQTEPALPTGPTDRDPEWFGVMLDAGVRFEPPFGHEEWAIRWLTVNPITVNELMLLLSSELTRAPSWQLLFELGDAKENPTAFHFFGPGCQQFETYLYAGGMEAALIGECDRLKRKLEECIKENRELLDQQTAKLLARWRSTE
jgi:hypothetical protein